jgi:hypothetical protein
MRPVHARQQSKRPPHGRFICVTLADCVNARLTPPITTVVVTLGAVPVIGKTVP